MSFPKLKNLCSPALFYFVFSMFFIVVSIMQNLGNTNSYYLGSFSCRVPNTTFIFILKLIYILFWTWILNLICKDGHELLSWFLVLFPFIILLVMIGLIMMNM